MRPLVSIITPTFNHEQYIRECIESVIKQSMPDWEMIIVDDASSDMTHEILNEYTKKDLRIKVISHKTNYGPGKLSLTYNEALSSATGRYIAILEGDDFWPDYRLKEQLKSFEGDSDIVLSHGGITIVSDGKFSGCSNSYPSPIRLNNPLGSALKAFLMGENPLFSTSVMIRKDVLLGCGGFHQMPSLYLVDYPTWMQIAMKGRFAFVDRSLGYWRRHPASITTLYQENLLIGYIDYANYFISKNRYSLLNSYSNLEKYVNNCSYNAFQFLCIFHLLSGNRLSSQKMLKEMLKRKRIIVSEKRLLMFLILILSVHTTPIIYKTAMKVNEILKSLGELPKKYNKKLYNI